MELNLADEAAVSLQDRYSQFFLERWPVLWTAWLHLAVAAAFPLTIIGLAVGLSVPVVESPRASGRLDGGYIAWAVALGIFLMIMIALAWIGRCGRRSPFALSTLRLWYAAFLSASAHFAPIIAMAAAYQAKASPSSLHYESVLRRPEFWIFVGLGMCAVATLGFLAVLVGTRLLIAVGVMAAIGGMLAISASGLIDRSSLLWILVLAAAAVAMWRFFGPRRSAAHGDGRPFLGVALCIFLPISSLVASMQVGGASEWVPTAAVAGAALYGSLVPALGGRLQKLTSEPGVWEPFRLLRGR